MTTGNKINDIKTASIVAEELLNEMEENSASVETYIMKALRIARLLKDSDAQEWLKLELRGYPQKFTFSSLGVCEKYARDGGRISEDNKYWLTSLPSLEAQVIADKMSLDKMDGLQTKTTAIKDFVAANATKAVMDKQQINLNTVKGNFVKNSGLYSSIKSSIHSYISEIYIGLQFGDFASDTFDKARDSVDTFVGKYCSKAVEKLLSITDRMSEEGNESKSLALTSCRRLLLDVADVVFQEQLEDYIDSNGNKRKVGVDNYKNRILAFFDKKKQSGSMDSILSSDIEHLAARLDAVYENSCKGVHADISEAEARLSVISTYLIIAEVARCYSPEESVLEIAEGIATDD